MPQVRSSVGFVGTLHRECCKIRVRQMAKEKDKAPDKTKPKDRAWFERRVAELKAELDKLPVDRQEQLKRELNENESGKVEG